MFFYRQPIGISLLYIKIIKVDRKQNIHDSKVNEHFEIT